MKLQDFKRVYDIRYSADFYQIVKTDNQRIWSYTIYDRGKFLHKGEAGKGKEEGSDRL